jgi:hypothetical protein
MLLIRQPPLFYSHPMANCFHRGEIVIDFKRPNLKLKHPYSADLVSETSTAEGGADLTSSAQNEWPKLGYVSTYIIGLSFKSGMKYVKLEPPIEVFSFSVIKVS